MIPTDLYDAYNTAITENDRQAKAALAAIVAQLDPADVNGVRDALLEAYPALVRFYGTRAAQVAIEFYTGVRKAQNVVLPFYAYLPTDEFEEVDQEAVADVRREIGGLYSGQSTIGAFASTMQGLATKRIMGMADSTLYALANADPARPKAAFVPHPGACGWCVMMGSRGFTNTKEAAENFRHDNCKCVVVMDFDTKNPALEGYDERALYDEYARADTPENQRKWLEEWNAMSPEERAKYVRRVRDRDGNVKEIPGDWSTYRRNRTVQEMNRSLVHSDTAVAEKTATTRAVASEMGFGGRYSSVHVYSAYSKCNATIGQDGEWGALSAGQRSAVLAELRERDTEWVRRGMTPAPTFETPELEAKLRSERNHELRTGEKLTGFGMRADYQVDTRSYYDDEKELWQDVGLADLTNGYELKTLQTGGLNSVDDYIRTSRKKEGVRAIVFDNSENKNPITDGELFDFLQSSRRWNDALYLITRDEKYLRAK